MMRKTFAISGNICGKRVRTGRALQDPSIKQEELAARLNLLGLDCMNKSIISKIERNQRHVCDAELRAFAEALGVTMEWLVGDKEISDILITK